MSHEKKSLTMKQLPVTERPYEKCEKNGVYSLSDAELLAILLQSGTKGEKVMDVAMALLNYDLSRPGLEGLSSLSLQNLRKVRGIGRVKAIQLVAVFELARRMTRVQFKEAYAFRNPESVARYFMAYMRQLKQEEVHVMMLDNKHRLIKECMITRGTVNASLIEPRDIFVQALRENAVNIILVHNHPSGDATPSMEDLQVTERVEASGQLVGIQLVDHIVIGNDSYSSIFGKWTRPYAHQSNELVLPVQSEK